MGGSGGLLGSGSSMDTARVTSLSVPAAMFASFCSPEVAAFCSASERIRAETCSTRMGMSVVSKPCSVTKSVTAFSSTSPSYRRSGYTLPSAFLKDIS